jgi:hypothetical protein
LATVLLSNVTPTAIPLSSLLIFQV